MIRPGSWVAALALPMTACGNVPTPTSQVDQGNRIVASPPAIQRATTPAKSEIAPWDASGCGDDAYQNAQMQRHPDLMGRSPEDLTAAFGTPSASERFKIGEPVGTFYGALGKRTPPSPDAGLPAQQRTWTRNGCNFTAFFVQRRGQWGAVEAYEWAVGADF